ncbi:MAG TPA: hypothetical protein VET88_15000, partial [Gammaproteobacteria bacterium]|nr:hypothetical protein [Gammaproteobacteria bacterium]
MSQALRQDIKPSAMTLLIFLCGATNDISLHVIGQYYVSEFLILIVAVFGLFLWRTYEALDTRILLSFMLAGLITLLGYVLSDIHVGTQPSQYLRGWGRTIIMITNCFAIMLLAMKDRQNLWWFILGSGTGGVIYLYLTGVPIESWKLGYGERVAMIFLTLLILAPRKSWGIALLGYGLLNIALDYRSLGAGLTLAAAILIASSVRPDKRFMALVVAGSVMLFSIVAAISLTQDEYIAHRMDSNIGRTSGIIVSLRAIAQSPLVGYGSWTVNKEFAAELRKEIRSRRAEAGGQVDFSRLRTGSGFQSH